VSPLFHAGKIRRPLLVLQCANDPRVIEPESDDIVAAVTKNGVPAEHVLFADDGEAPSAERATAWRRRRGGRRSPVPSGSSFASIAARALTLDRVCCGHENERSFTPERSPSPCTHRPAASFFPGPR
jgi:hypothetical protein